MGQGVVSLDPKHRLSVLSSVDLPKTAERVWNKSFVGGPLHLLEDLVVLVVQDHIVVRVPNDQKETAWGLQSPRSHSLDLSLLVESIVACVCHTVGVFLEEVDILTGSHYSPFIQRDPNPVNLAF